MSLRSKVEIDFKNLRYTFRDSVKVTELYFKEGVDDSDQCWTDGINSGSCPTKGKYFNFAGNSSKLPICKTLEEVHCIKAHAHAISRFLKLERPFLHQMPSIDARRGSASRKHGVIYLHQLG